LMAKRRPVVRTGVAVAAALAGFGFFTLLRNERVNRHYQMDTPWRWSPTPKSLMLPPGQRETSRGHAGPGLPGETTHESGQKYAPALGQPEGPGFRGSSRAALVLGPRLSTNWAAHPPEQLWRIPLGPAWSSFAVAGQRLFTQEQRGPMEAVVCYDADTGRQ